MVALVPMTWVVKPSAVVVRESGTTSGALSSCRSVVVSESKSSGRMRTHKATPRVTQPGTRNH